MLRPWIKPSAIVIRSASDRKRANAARAGRVIDG
jgi:hypothetical protein